MKNHPIPNRSVRAGSGCLVQIRGRVQCILGNDAYYRLYEVRRAGLKTYAVNVSYGRDSEFCRLGGNRASACEIFDRLADGSVTPTTLCDVVSDWKRERQGEI